MIATYAYASIYGTYIGSLCAMATVGSSSAAAGNIRKRVVLTIEDKLNICSVVKSGRSLTSAAAEFNVVKLINRSRQRMC